LGESFAAAAHRRQAAGMVIHPDILRELAATRYDTPLPSRCAPARPAHPAYGAKKARTSSSVTRARGLPVAIRPTMRR
jgi:hypothetical protein